MTLAKRGPKVGSATVDAGSDAPTLRGKCLKDNNSASENHLTGRRHSLSKGKGPSPFGENGFMCPGAQRFPPPSLTVQDGRGLVRRGEEDSCPVVE